MKNYLLIFVFIFISTSSWTAAFRCPRTGYFTYNCNIENVDLIVSVEGDYSTTFNLAIRKGEGPVPNITENTFDHLEGITTIYIYDIAPQWVSPFKNLQSVKEVRFTMNHYTEFPRSIVQLIPHLKIIYLEGQMIKRLSKSSFAEVPETLEVLTGSHLQLQTIESGTFSRFIHLKILILLENSLSVLQPGIFDGLASLEGLDLSNNEISILRPGVFADLLNLRHLVLNANNLTQLPDRIFSDLKSLEKLEIRGNWFITLTNVLFEGLPMLKTWTCGDVVFQQMEPIQLTDYCRDYDDETYHIKKCRTLMMVEMIFQRDLNPLSSDKNSTEYEEPYSLTMTSYNAPYFIIILNVTEESLINLPKLKYIQVNSIQIRGANPFKNQESVTALALLSNFLTEFPREFCAVFPRLTILQVEHQNINNLTKDSFIGISDNLKELSLEHNQLKTIEPGTFSIFENLKTLNLANNKLEILPSNLFDDLRSLAEVRLEYNSISTLFFNTLNFHNLRKISMSLESFGITHREAINKTENLEVLELIVPPRPKGYEIWDSRSADVCGTLSVPHEEHMKRMEFLRAFTRRI